jgi:hypothetical protein
MDFQEQIIIGNENITENIIKSPRNIMSESKDTDKASADVKSPQKFGYLSDLSTGQQVNLHAKEVLRDRNDITIGQFQEDCFDQFIEGLNEFCDSKIGELTKSRFE